MTDPQIDMWEAQRLCLAITFRLETDLGERKTYWKRLLNTLIKSVPENYLVCRGILTSEQYKTFKS
jgi:hypothetical protein